MSNKIIDKIFGEMEYKHSWTKKDSFVFLSKPYVVNIVAQAYTGDKILDSQRANYVNYKRFLDEHKVEIEKKLLDYCKEICNNSNISLGECLKPTTIIFERDNSWGILFETDCDIENGVALFVINDKIEVGPQDLYL